MKKALVKVFISGKPDTILRIFFTEEPFTVKKLLEKCFEDIGECSDMFDAKVECYDFDFKANVSVKLSDTAIDQGTYNAHLTKKRSVLEYATNSSKQNSELGLVITDNANNSISAAEVAPSECPLSVGHTTVAGGVEMEKLYTQMASSHREDKRHRSEGGSSQEGGGDGFSHMSRGTRSSILDVDDEDISIDVDAFPQIKDDDFLLHYDSKNVEADILTRRALGSTAHCTTRKRIVLLTLVRRRVFAGDFTGDFAAWKNMNLASQCVAGSADLENRFKLLGVDLEQKSSVLTELSPVAHYGNFVKDLSGAQSRGVCDSFAIVRTFCTKSVEVDLSRHAEKILKGRALNNATHIINRVGYGIVAIALVTTTQRNSNVERFAERVRSMCDAKHEDFSFLDKFEKFVSVELFAHTSLSLPHTTTLCNAIETLRNLEKFAKMRNGLGYPMFYSMLPLEKLINANYLSAVNMLVLNEHDKMSKEKIVELMCELHLYVTEMNKMSVAFRDFGYCLNTKEYENFLRLINEFTVVRDSLLATGQKFLMEMRSFNEKDQLFNTMSQIMKNASLDESRSFDAFKERYFQLQKFVDDGMKVLREISKTLREFGTSRAKIGYANAYSENGKKCFVCFQQADVEIDKPDENFVLFNKLLDAGETCIYYGLPSITHVERMEEEHSVDLIDFGLNDAFDCLKDDDFSEKHLDVDVSQASLIVDEPCAETNQQEDLSDEDVDGAKSPDAIQHAKDVVQDKTEQQAEQSMDEQPDDAELVKLEKLVKEIAEYMKFGGWHVAKFRAGQLMPDYLAEMERKRHISLAMTAVRHDECEKPPFGTIPLEIPCSRSVVCGGRCPDKDYLWQCDECEQLIMYFRENNADSAYAGKDKSQADNTSKQGSDEAFECLETGKSHTTQPRSYVFLFKGGKLRIVDTPGIGDTDGPEQDKKNFQNILRYISTLKEIHGICILLKPNDSRLTIVFKYCINELLTHLHKDAAKNIVFCFTNTSGTRYRPGDTFPQLKKLLAELK